jgi:hypothetical protein
MLGLITSAPALTMPTVVPSGADFATMSVPSTPPWPGRLSTTTVWPVISDMRCPTTRAMMSLGPPGGNGTISRIGFLGRSSAAAKVGNSSSDKSASFAIVFIMCLPFSGSLAAYPQGEEATERPSPDDAPHRRENHEGPALASPFETPASQAPQGEAQQLNR